MNLTRISGTSIPVIGVVGSRTYEDYDLLKRVLRDFIPCLIVSGGAKGADSLAEKFASESGIPITVYEAEWDTYGKSAGFRRNQLIVDDSDFIVAFWDGESKGTADTLNKAKKSKVPTLIIYF